MYTVFMCGCVCVGVYMYVHVVLCVLQDPTCMCSIDQI